MCLCSDIHRLKDSSASDEEVVQLEDKLESHLDAICILLSKSKRLSQKLSFQVNRRKAAKAVRQKRTASLFQRRFDYDGQKDVFEKSKTNPQAFWCPIKDDLTPANESQSSLLQDFVYSTLHSFLRLDQVETHQILVRRLSCVVVALLSKVLPYRYEPELIAKSFHDVGLFRDLPGDTLQEGILQFRNAGKRYMDIAFQLGGIGAVWCLPLDVARTVWERYLPKSGVELNKAIEHLVSMGIVEQSRGYCDFVKQLIYYKIRPIFADIPSLEFYLNPPVEEIEAPSRIVTQQRAYVPAAQTSLLSFSNSLTNGKRKTKSQLRSAPPTKRQQYETHGRSPPSRFSQDPSQSQASAPNESRQQQLVTTHQDDRLLSCPLPTNDRAQDPLIDISLNETNIDSTGTESLAQHMQHVDRDSTSSHPRFVSPPGSQVHAHCHDVDQHQTGESISDTLGLERTSISTISALLNNDDNTPTTDFVTTQDSIQDSEDNCTEVVSSVTGQLLVAPAVPPGVATTPLGVIQVEKSYLQQIVIDRPTDIVGDIWFGNLPGSAPFVSLRLSKALGDIIKPSGQEVFIHSPAPDANRMFEGVYSVKFECFRELIQRDGFGRTYWNETKGTAFVSIDVMDENLIADLFQACKQAIGDLPMLDAVPNTFD